ncbi:hypothetical protein HD597_002480 [Nonomuraea thailandensis]|uniref:Uncharacterized protein n=1 Tax=Nonomuraea thailandensis TaxID=1188745 RepID=A0A9X2GD59_9ACTN|nr:hypothetical protein [Nonomuraea thailandensis]MCP2355460.1 hypothetical protein [Nonomuraea thailandensis]
MRISVAVAVPLLLCLAACGPAPLAPPPAPPTSPAAPEPSPAAPEPSAGAPGPSAAPKRSASSGSRLAGPGTVCGEAEAANGSLAAVAVHRGRADCAQALRVLRAYYRPQTPKQGSAGVATVAGWECVSNTAAESMRTGRLTSCRKGGATIVADVIP